MSTKLMTQPWLWKRDTSNSIDSYTGVKDEPVIDMRSPSNHVLRIMDGITPGGIVIDAGVPSGIARSTLTGPVDGLTEIALTPSLASGRFNAIREDRSADIHAASYWEIATDFNFISTVYSSGRDTNNLLSIDLPPSVILDGLTEHYVRVRHEATEQGVSEWSPVTSFTTRSNIPASIATVITANDANNNDYFGVSVAISGDGLTAAIGAHYDDDNGLSTSGSIYIFKRINNVWVQEQKIHPNAPASNHYFGISVSLNGDGTQMIVGAIGDGTNGSRSGAAYYFTLSGNTWTEQQKFHPNDTGSSRDFGNDLSISSDGNHAIVGSYKDSSYGNVAGSAYYFTRIGNVWSQQQKLNVSDYGPIRYFGFSVGMSGDGTIALISATYDDDNGLVNSGSAYVFTRSGSVWTEQQKIHPVDKRAEHYFGTGISVNHDGSLAAICTYVDDDQGSQTGAAYIFSRTDTIWTQQQKLYAFDPVVGKNFGRSTGLSADGTYMLAGGHGYDHSGLTSAGKVYIFN